MFSKFVIQCLAMLINNEVTEGLLYAVLGANFVLLFFIAWHVATARLYFRQVRRLAIPLTEKMDCGELIDGLLSCSGEHLRNDKGTAGDSLVSPDACSRETAGQQQLLRNDKVTGQTAVQDRVQNNRERLASIAAGGQAGRYVGVVSMFLPIPAEDQPGLIADFEGDPFAGHALSSATCELYHCYDIFLAPLTTALTTIKHCQF